MAKKKAQKPTAKKQSVKKATAKTKVSSKPTKKNDGGVVRSLTVPQIVLPKGGVPYLAGTLTGGTLGFFVHAGPFNANAAAYAKVHAVGADPNVPANSGGLAGSGFQQLDPDGTFRNKSVSFSGITAATSPTDVNNVSVTVVKVENGATAVDLVGTASFIYYASAAFQVAVQAYCCPWFAFRSSGTGPQGENVNDHRPVRMILPINSTSLSVTGSAGIWRHAPNANAPTTPPTPPDSDAAGYGGPWPLWDARYETDSNLGTGGFLPIELQSASSPKHNLLVGILEPMDVSELEDVAPKILKIGHGTVGFSAGANRAIHLGMWDGGQWTRSDTASGISNSGFVTLSITWTVEDPGN